jgi:hypothetical protein
MLQRLSPRERNRLKQARWRARQRRDVIHTQGDVPRVVAEMLVAENYLAPKVAEDGRAIHAAMVRLLLRLSKN